MKKKFILVICIVSILLILSGFIIYAASVQIEYNYNVILDTPNWNDSNVLDDSTIDIITTTKIDNYKYTEHNGAYIYKNLKKNEYKNRENDNDKVFPNTIKYIVGDKTKIIVYQNEFIYSFDDIIKANYSSYYNNLIDYLGNKDVVYAARFYLLANIDINEDIIISRPISLEIMDDVTLSLNGNIILKHSHPGNYYIKLNENSKISSEQNKIIITAPNASYEYSDNVKAYINNENQELSIEDAKEFILNYIPDYQTNDIYLPKYYMSTSITYKYEFDEKEDGERELTIIITDGNKNETITKKYIYCKSYGSLGLILEKELSTNNLFRDYDLLRLLIDIDYNKSINISSTSNDLYFVINEKSSFNSISLEYNENDGRYYHVSNEGNTKINSLVIRRKMTNTKEFTISIGTGTNLINKTINLDYPSDVEKLEFMKSYSNTYVISRANLGYNIFYNKDDKTYFGNTVICDGLLFDNLTIKMFNKASEGDDYTEYIEYTNLDGQIKMNNVEENFSSRYLAYYSNNKELFRIPIVKSLNSSSGSGVDFESNNPFDSLFTDQTNWLKDNTFTMPSGYDNIYANIEIISINGVSYDYNNHTDDISIRGSNFNVYTHKMVYISKDSNTLVSDKYSREIRICVNIDYVPITNSVVYLKCELYNNGDGAKTVTATHYYTYTIPGILKQGDNSSLSATLGYSPYSFIDQSFYQKTINYFSNSGYTDYFRNVGNTSYILANVKNIIEFIPGFKSDIEMDISGIEMLTNTNKIILDNIAIKTLEPFKYFNATVLKELSLSNCSLTKDKLSSFLYGIEIEKLDLSNNDFSLVETFNKLLFRTIKELNLSNSKLVTIKGLDSVIYLNELYINNNNILNFEALKNMNYLIDVYLYDNSSNNDYYGTGGKVNKCVYYWIYKTNNVSIYINNDTIINDDYFNDIEKQILALNALVMPTAIGTEEKKQLQDYFKNFSVYELTFEIDSFENGLLIIKCTNTSDNTSCYREFYYEVNI